MGSNKDFENSMRKKIASILLHTNEIMKGHGFLFCIKLADALIANNINDTSEYEQRAHMLEEKMNRICQALNNTEYTETKIISDIHNIVSSENKNAQQQRWQYLARIVKAGFDRANDRRVYPNLPSTYYEWQIDGIVEELMKNGVNLDATHNTPTQSETLSQYEEEVYVRALHSLARKYVTAANISTIVANDGEKYVAGKELCAIYAVRDELLNAQKQ